MANKKTAVPVSSVGADGEQSIYKNTNQIISKPQQQINVQAAKSLEKSGQGGLDTISMIELYDTIYLVQKKINNTKEELWELFIF